MKKILLSTLFISSLIVMSCSKAEEATTSSDVNVNYVIVSTNASRSQWEYTDKDGVTQKGSLPGNATKTINQNFHKPATAYVKLKALQNNINTNVTASVFIINTSSGDTLARSAQSLKTDSIEVTISKLLN
jgi:hypothetical protein